MFSGNSEARFRFSLKTLLVVSAFVGIICGWWVQYSRLTEALASERQRSGNLRNAANAFLFKHLDDDAAKGRLVSDFPIKAFADKTFDKSELSRDAIHFPAEKIPPGGKFVG
jgi:hypothetical protein